MAFGVLDFIDSDGIDLPQGPMPQTPGDGVVDRVEDLIPGSMKRLGGLLPRKPARPAGQKQHVGGGQVTLAIAPRNFLDDDGTASTAIDAPHGVQEEDQESPERDELKAPLGKPIVTGRRSVATGADRHGALPWTNGDLDHLLVGSETIVVVDESPMVVAVV